MLNVCLASVADRVAPTFDSGAESETATDVTVELNRRCGVAVTSVSERDLRLGSFNVSALGWAPPVLATSPAGADVVVEPVDVEVMDDVGVEDAAALDAPVFAPAEELDGALLTDSAEVESEVDGLDGSAHAIP